MKRIPLALTGALLLSTGLYGLPGRVSLESRFSQANAEYQRGAYVASEQSYRQLLSAGVDNGALYYNLGNACFKQKKLGEAIYYWEKARRKLPNDPDVRENLDLANLMVVDRIEVPAEPLPVRLFRRLQDLFSIRQQTRVVLILFVLANLLFSVYLLARGPRLSFRALIASLSLGAVTLIFGCSLILKIYDQGHRIEGIVIEQKADARSGPGTDNITVFTVHEGIKVRVRGEAGGWYQVSLPNGWNGWLPQDSLRIL